MALSLFPSRKKAASKPHNPTAANLGTGNEPADSVVETPPDAPGQHESPPTSRADVEHPLSLLSEALSQKSQMLESSNKLHRRAVLGLIVSNMLAGAAALVGLSRSTEYRYFFVDENGSIVENVPLSEPMHSQAVIRNFLSKSVAELFSFHYRNVEMHLQRYAHTVMTEMAFRDIVSELDRIGLVRQMRERREVAIATVPDSPVLIASGVDNGVRTWEYAAQIVILLEAAETSSSGSNRGRSRRLSGELRAQLIRVPPEISPRGVLINRLQIFEEGTN